MYCLNVITDDLLPLLGRLLESLARYLFFFIGKFIYGAIRYVYNIFVTLCNGRILDNDSIMALFSRIGVILGVIMLFVVSFSVIQLLVDPDAIADKEKGIQNIVKKVIFVIIMLGVSGYVFNILTEVQAIVIERDIIPRLLLPKAVSTENVGGNLSAELFMIFYQVNVDPPGDGCDETYRDETKVAIADDDWDYVPDCLIEGDGEDYVFYMEYNWLFSTLFGIAALYMIFSYCITVGVRLIQLTFLQIISPAAIIGYLSPKKDNIFSKWLKIYFSTYIDVFIRIAIINFAMYLIALIMDGWQNQTTGFWASVGSPGLGTKGFIAAIMILAILQFAKKAPELLKQLLPQGASGLGYGVSTPSQFLKDNPIVSRAFGVGRVGLGRAVGNARRAGGKFLDEKDKYENKLNAARTDANTDLGRAYWQLQSALNSGDQESINMQQKEYNNQLAKFKKDNYGDVSKWRRRILTGGLSGLASGTIAGAKTKDSSSRKNATKVGMDRQKANWNLSDKGYGIRERIEDMPNSFLMRDTNLSMKTDDSDMQLASISDQLTAARQALKPGDARLFKDSSGNYYEIVNNERNYRNDNYSGDQYKDSRNVADLQESYNKEKKINSSLHQRDNEKKND